MCNHRHRADLKSLGTDTRSLRIHTCWDSKQNFHIQAKIYEYHVAMDILHHV